MHSSGINVISLFIGVVIVALFAKRFFDEGDYDLEPAENDILKQSNDYLRFTTPFLTAKGRYTLWSRFFVSIVIGYYILLTLGITAADLSKLAPESSAVEKAIAPFLQHNSVLIAILFTGAVPNIPILKDLLTRMRDRMHKAARIPEQIRGVIELLTRKLNTNDPALIEACLTQSPRAIDATAFTLPLESPAAFLSRTAYVLRYIDEHLRSMPRYRPTLDRFQNHIGRTKGDLENLLAALVMQSSLSPQEHGNITYAARRLFRRSIKLLVVITFTTETQDWAALNKLSVFNKSILERQEIKPPVIEFLATAIITSVVAILLIFVLKAIQEGINLPADASKEVIRGGVLYFGLSCGPSLLAVLLKGFLATHWPNRIPTAPRNLNMYLLCAAIGSLVGAGILFSAEYFHIAGFSAKHGLVSLLFYSSVSGAIGLVAALCLDCSRERWFDFSAPHRAIKIAGFASIAGMIAVVALTIASFGAAAWTTFPQGARFTELLLEAGICVPLVMLQGWSLYRTCKRRYRYASNDDILNDAWAQLPDDVRVRSHLTGNEALGALLSTHANTLPSYWNRFLVKQQIVSSEPPDRPDGS